MQEGALSITITGHSKGGALAHVFAERLASDSKVLKTATINAITFAAPIAFSYKKLEDAPRLDFIHNYVISSDPVPYCPALLGNKDAVHGLLEGVLKKVVTIPPYAASYGPVGNIYLAQDILNDIEAEYKKSTSDDFRGLLQSGGLKSILDTKHHSMVHYARIAVNRARRFQFDLDKAEKGDKDAQYYVASSYFGGVGVRKNEKAALDWFKKSAARGQSIAQYEVARFYTSGLGGVTVNEDMANIYFDMAMSQEQPTPENHPMIDRGRK
jgi:hypothetical protein